MARTADELLEEEEEEEQEQAVESEEEDDAVPYNPKNLPLGWDGKVRGRGRGRGREVAYVYSTCMYTYMFLATLPFS